MKYKFSAIEWDRIDEDRWIRASISSLIVLYFCFLLLKTIELPKSPEKTIIEEKFEFYHVEKKKKVKIKKDEDIPEPEKDKPTENQPEIVLPSFFKKKFTRKNKYSKAKPDDIIRKFERNQQSKKRSSVRTRFNRGYDYKPVETETDIIQGFSRQSYNPSLSSQAINPDRDPNGIDESFGIDTAPIESYAEATHDQISIFSDDIKMEDVLDPLLKWIQEHASPIYKIARMQMRVNPNTDYTTSVFYTDKGRQYEILLSGNIGKKQITFCIVDLTDNSYYMLIDQGLKRRSNLFHEGFVERKDSKEIIEFTGKRSQASSSAAKKFENIFWKWAQNTIKG